MYSKLILLFCFSLAFTFELNIPINRINRVVIFGDSLSDTGNVYKITNHAWPIVPPYYQGRFCNGPNYADKLNVLLKFNYAYGGATTDNNLVQGLTKLNQVPIPGVRQQVATYLNDTEAKVVGVIRPVHIIWAGGNDFIFNSSLSPIQIVNSLMNSAKDLLTAGARNLIVFNQAPVDAFPYIRAYNQPAYFAQLTNISNNAIQTNLQQLQANYTKASVNMFDLYALIKNILSNPQPPINNTVGKCWDNYNITAVTRYCQDPTNYLFLDNFHFSSTVQELIAQALQPYFSFGFQKNAPGSYIRSF